MAYLPGDPRNDEVEKILDYFLSESPELPFCSITPTTYKNLPSRKHSCSLILCHKKPALLFLQDTLLQGSQGNPLQKFLANQ